MFREVAPGILGGRGIELSEGGIGVFFCGRLSDWIDKERDVALQVVEGDEEFVVLFDGEASANFSLGSSS